MDFSFLLTHNSIFLLCSVIVLALVVGSFLNVVIYRFPRMMQHQWREQCHEFLQIAATGEQQSALNLAYPASHCPHCQHKLAVTHNIPLVSFLLLRGKCAFCKHPISWQYPLVELTTALLSFAIIYYFGLSLQAAAGLWFTWLLICLTVIDLQHQLLPDELNYIGIWTGLFLSLFHIFTDTHSAIIGGLVGYLSLWTIAMLFKILMKKEGMGHGDFKLLALLGCWLGWQMLPLIILIASFLGAVIGISLIVSKKLTRDIPIPFGPYLAIAGWITLFWGKNLLNLYLDVYL